LAVVVCPAPNPSSGHHLAGIGDDSEDGFVFKRVVAFIVGVVVGATGPAYAFLGAYSLIPWGLIAVALGLWGSRREVLKSGAIYGFSLSFAFLVSGYNGTRTLVSRFPFFAILALFGAVSGVALSAVGYELKLRFAPPPAPGAS
jgi:hypothetical protein